MHAPHPPHPLSRRRFLQFGTAWIGACAVGPARGASRHAPLNELVGVNTSSFARQNRETDPAQRIDPYDVPRVLREEVDVRVIDLVSTMLGTREPGPLERFRAQAERAGCIITNLKVNDRSLPFDGDDESERRRALDEYKRWIDAAALLGARWLRPFPAATAPRWETLVAGYSELADHAAKHDITLLVENYRWIEAQPEAIPRLVKAVNGRIAAQPDTFNWKDHAIRLQGLALAFPHARSADFKVRELGPAGEHPAYDLRACFELGRKAGFHGPWCIEHVNADKTRLLHELRFIAGQLRTWQAAPPGQE
jgi:sugar phosphate isomerase/epimerase